MLKIADLRYEYWFIIKCCIQCSYAVAIDDAIACARALVVNSNSNNYPVYSSDCTNFASQILENEMALSAIGKEYTLDDFSYKNYKIYGQIGWQFNPDDQEMLIQSNRISHFADIYENSFNRSGNELVSFICSMLFNRFGTEVSQ